MKKRAWQTVLGAVAVMAMTLTPVSPVVLAATPSSGSLTAPTAIGASVSTSWTGTIQPGLNSPAGAGLRCFTSTANNATGSDPFQLKLIGTTTSYYLSHSAKLVLTLTWTPVVSGALNQLTMTAAEDDGTGNLSNIQDGQGTATGTTVALTYTNPAENTGASFLYVGVCAARNTTPQNYKVTAKLTVGNPINNYPGLYSNVFGFQDHYLPGPPTVGTPLGTSRYGEPGIWINKNGRGIINTFGPTVWTTTNDGLSWSAPWDLGNVNDASASCPLGYDADGDGVVGPDNVFYADNLCVAPVPSTTIPVIGPPAQNDSFTNKSDGVAGASGANWAGPYFAGGNVDRQWYAVDPKQAGLVYMSFHDFQGPDINFLKSTDGGVTFTCPVLGATLATCPVTLTQNANNPNSNFISTGLANTTGRPLIDPTNTKRIYVPYIDNVAFSSLTAPPTNSDPDLTRLRVAVSTDGGTTWSANTDPGGNPALDANAAFPYDGTNDNVIAHLFNTAAIDTAGNLYVMFSLRLGHKASVNGTAFSGTSTHVYLITSTDHGLTWSKPAQVDPPGLNSNVFQWIVAGDPGRIAMSWYASKIDSFDDTSGQWSEMFAESTNALSSAPAFTVANASGVNPIHNGDICQAGIDCQVTGGNRDLSDFQMLTIDVCGHAQLVWTEDTGVGVTRVGRQTSGPLLYNTDPCAPPTTTTTTTSTSTTPLQSPNTGGGPVAPGAAILALLAIGGGVLALTLRVRRS